MPPTECDLYNYKKSEDAQSLIVLSLLSKLHFSSLKATRKQLSVVSSLLCGETVPFSRDLAYTLYRSRLQVSEIDLFFIAGVPTSRLFKEYHTIYIYIYIYYIYYIYTHIYIYTCCFPHNPILKRMNRQDVLYARSVMFLPSTLLQGFCKRVLTCSVGLGRAGSRG